MTNRRQLRQRCCYTLDVLTDGSEHTGHGTLFLSVWKVRPNDFVGSTTDINNNEHSLKIGGIKSSTSEISKDVCLPAMDTTPIARYVISGIGDAFARLCADQRFKLLPTRAVFIPAIKQKQQQSESKTVAFNQNISSTSCALDGLSALLLALHGAGSPSLHVVTPSVSDMVVLTDLQNNRSSSSKKEGEIIEELVTITLGSHKHFDIRTCQVRDFHSSESSNEDAVSTPTWWKVYDDEYLEVHASFVGINGGDNNSLIFLYSLTVSEMSSNSHSKTSNGTTAYNHVAVLPPRCSNVIELFEERLTNRRNQLPLIGDGVPISKINYVIGVDPISLCVSKTNNELLIMNDFFQRHSSTRFFINLPQQEPVDKGVLIRSQQLDQFNHQHMPWAFCSSSVEKISSNMPTAKDGTQEEKNHVSDPIGKLAQHLRNHRYVNLDILESGTSILFDSFDKCERNSIRPLLVDRRKEIWDKTLNEQWVSTIDNLKTFVPEPTSAEDENEIELDGDDNDDNEGTDEEKEYNWTRTSHLLVLGTGCATPSAYRGASGYALILGRDQEIFLLDCGEGISTMLSRHCQYRIPDWKLKVRGIWISHAHLDHYGGLPTLIRILYEARMKNFMGNRVAPDNQPPNKRSKSQDFNSCIIPWVMAPSKVFQYLDLLLQCHHGRCRYTNQQYYIPRVHNDSTLYYTPPLGPPWIHFENVLVNHNCCPSYGLLLGWKTHNQDRQYNYLCYSGDTRPSHNLVTACQKVLRRNIPTAKTKLMLIHEATFEDNEIEMAIKKKHSTINEAIQVGRDVNASQILLTHFSQRYISLNTNNTESATNNNTTSKNDERSVVDATNCKVESTLSTTTNSQHNIIPGNVGLAIDGLWIPLEIIYC